LTCRRKRCSVIGAAVPHPGQREVDLCPVAAFTGIPFNPAEDVELRFRRSECRAYLSQRGKAYGASACGLCVYVCPHGWSAKRKRDGQRTTPEILRRQLTGARRLFEASA